jgi:hypothetical protein
MEVSCLYVVKYSGGSRYFVPVFCSIIAMRFCSDIFYSWDASSDYVTLISYFATLLQPKFQSYFILCPCDAKLLLIVQGAG